MKKTDIENFERRNPYEVPESFFSEMQNNVLEKVAEKQKPKGRIIPMKYFTGIAASLTLLIGTVLFWYSNNNEITTQEKIVDQQVVVENIQPKIAGNSTDVNKSPEGEISENEKKFDDKFNFDENSASNPKKAMVTGSKGTYNRPKVVSAVDRNFDKALNKLNAQELAEQSKKYEIDTYLDLY
ncbi:TPA: hypothetical protein ACW7X5_001444 [Elizabethkingia meningoseptica]